MIFHNSKYVSFRIYVDGSYRDKLLTKRMTKQDTSVEVPDQFSVKFNGVSIPCKANRWEQGIECRLDFKTIKSATVAELCAELASRIGTDHDYIEKLKQDERDIAAAERKAKMDARAAVTAALIKGSAT